jgi:hypothetical protein
MASSRQGLSSWLYEPISDRNAVQGLSLRCYRRCTIACRSRERTATSLQDSDHRASDLAYASPLLRWLVNGPFEQSICAKSMQLQCHTTPDARRGRPRTKLSGRSKPRPKMSQCLTGFLVRASSDIATSLRDRENELSGETD